jgi:hypothetical protein
MDVIQKSKWTFLFWTPQYCFILYILKCLYSSWFGLSHFIVQFLNPMQGLKDCLDGESTHHEAATCAQNNTNTE